MLTVSRLAASERRIAELPPKHTHRANRPNLFVNARTVEGHLTERFLKLRVKARTS